MKYLTINRRVTMTMVRVTMIVVVGYFYLSGHSAIAQGKDVVNNAQPNIILIVADDLGFTDLGCYGGEINTPNLDKLAREGKRFTQFYNGAVCNVSRAALLTGTYPRIGKGRLLKDNMVTMAEVLHDAGYATIMSGKWHLGAYPTSPVDRGFQEYYGSMIGAFSYFDPSLPDPPFANHSGPDSPFVHNNEVLEGVPDDYYSTDAFTDHAIAQIKNSVKQNKPFFLHLAYNAPHYPLQALPNDIARYRGKYDEGYTVLRETRYKKAVALGVIDKKWELPDTDKKLGAFNYDLEVVPWDSLSKGDKIREAAKMEVYAAMVDRMDQNVGRVMETLRESGIDDNTIVIFFSDNGGCASIVTEVNARKVYMDYNRGKVIGGKDSYEFVGPGWATAQSSPFRRYKVWAYEGGISTPMIIRWKGKIATGTMTDEPFHLVDLLPTFIDISGATYPKELRGNEIMPLEGSSMKPVLMGDEGVDERELGWYLYGNKAYRKGKWKLVWGVTAKKWELYDMEDDRTETHDLAAMYPEIVRQLSDAWKRWAISCEVPAKDI